MKTVLTQLRDTLLELSTTMEIITDHDKGYQECLINLAQDIDAQQLGYEREMIEKAFDCGTQVIRVVNYTGEDYFTQTYKNE